MFEEIMQKPAEYRPEHPVIIENLDRIRFQGVTFRHRNARNEALSEVSFHLEAGETIAFVGPSGSGKSTLVKLLSGLYRPTSGSILYGGHDSLVVGMKSIRDRIGLVTQDTHLFAGTIKENLLFVKPDATDSEILTALNKASCQNLLARAEKGLDTTIGEGGIKVSGGEKQRLSIARALLRNPGLLLLDEATSALDSITEEEITSTIRALNAQRTVMTILIAHRLSTIMHADRIYVLEKGRIIEQGSHGELVAMHGLYFAMWRQQQGERQREETIA
jgi:ATP-binding cassette subfamily B protein